MIDHQPLVTHLRDRLPASALETDPMPHLVLRDVFPSEVYRTLLESIPPVSCFSSQDRIKQNFMASKRSKAPEPIRTLWNWLEDGWAGACLSPLVMPLFEPALRAHYAALFGPEYGELALEAPAVRMGRLMLRRPGYDLKPHRDPLASAVTVLLYFAKPGDNAAFGTQLYRVRDDRFADNSKPTYPPLEQCELVRDVPFTPNTALIFMNTLGGAHGARIPADAPADLERYSYQCYIGLAPERLSAVLAALPAGAQARWPDKYR